MMGSGYRLSRSNTNLSLSNGSKMMVAGECNVPCMYNKAEQVLSFLVADGPASTGYPWDVLPAWLFVCLHPMPLWRQWCSQLKATKCLMIPSFASIYQYSVNNLAVYTWKVQHQRRSHCTTLHPSPGFPIQIQQRGVQDTSNIISAHINLLLLCSPYSNELFSLNNPTKELLNSMATSFLLMTICSCYTHALLKLVICFP